MQLNSVISSGQYSSSLPKKRDLVPGDILSFRILPPEIRLQIGGYMTKKKDFSSFSRIEVITSVLRRGCFTGNPHLAKEALEAYDFDIMQVPQDLIRDINEVRMLTFIVGEEITPDKLIALMKYCPRVTAMHLVVSSTMRDTEWLASLGPYCTNLKELVLTGSCEAASLAAFLRHTLSLETLHVDELTVDTHLCTALSALTRLQELVIGEAEALIDEDIVLLPPTLQTLELVLWEGTEKSVKLLTAHLTNLENLYLSSCCEITESGFEELKKLSLKKLGVCGCPGFGNRALDTVLSIPTLRSLQVQFTAPFQQVAVYRNRSLLTALSLDMKRVTEGMLQGFVRQCPFVEELTLENVSSNTGLQRVKEFQYLNKITIDSCESSHIEKVDAELDGLREAFVSLHIDTSEQVKRSRIAAIYAREFREYTLQHSDVPSSNGKRVAYLIQMLVTGAGVLFGLWGISHVSRQA